MKLYKITKDGKLIFVGDEFTCLGKAQSLSPFSMGNINNPYKIEPWDGEFWGCATHHYLGDCILCVDNIPEFCDKRDAIFKKYISDHTIKNGISYSVNEHLQKEFYRLAGDANKLYNEITKNDYKMSESDKKEFGWLFANDFKGWLMDQGY